VEIAGFLRRIKVEDPAEAPEAKKLMLDKNGTPIYEVLSLYTSKVKQLALTQEDSTIICTAATLYLAELGKSRMNPEWLWASWSRNNYRGRIAVASEVQAKLVTALFNSLKVEGVPPFRLWRAHEVEELTSVRLTLTGGTCSPGKLTKSSSSCFPGMNWKAPTLSPPKAQAHPSRIMWSTLKWTKN
jgi:hypothetical protein